MADDLTLFYKTLDRVKCNCKSKVFYLYIDKKEDTLIVQCHKCKRVILKFKQTIDTKLDTNIGELNAQTNHATLDVHEEDSA